MSDNSVSIIIPTRGPNHLDRVFKNYEEVYPEMNKHFFIVEQADDDVFKKGPLYNIGVKHASSEYIALADNDIVHFRPINWINGLNAVKKPVIGFTHITQVRFDGDKMIRDVPKLHPWSFGGFVFLTREQYLEANGYSNLYAGWGYEDNDWASRIDYVRVPQDLGHITHPKRDNANPAQTERNRRKFETRMCRDNMLDGYLQTTFDYVDITESDNVTTIRVKDISVVDDFKYKDLL